MALSYLFDPNTQFQNKNGVNNVFGHLEVFINDSDDHAPTYCNFTGTLNPEKIVLDNNGRAVVIVDELKTYRIEVYDRSGNMLWSQYPVRPTNVIYGDYNVYNADIYGTPDEIDVDVETSASGVKKFTIKLANAVKTVIGNIQDTISSIVETVSTKADKVQGATAGNLAALDANGNLADSGKKTADFKTKQTDVSVTGGSLKGVASMSQNANGEVTLTLNDIQDGTTAQKGVVQLSNAINSTSTTEAATPKAVKDAYDDLNNKIVARAVFLSQAEWAVQSQLPGDPAKVYYVENGTGEDAYTVYVWKDSTSEYVEVDESSIDLDGYWHDGPTTTGNGNVVTDISLGNDGVPQVEKGMSAEPAFSVLPVDKGGTGKTTGKAATKNLFSDINNVSTDPDDTARIVFKYGSPSDSNGIFFARAITNLWNYIKSKISSVLGLSEDGYTGNAATATSATTATNYASGGGIANAINAKQDTISDLATIRSGASAGASALQPSGNGSNLSVTPDGTSTGYDLGSSTTLKAFAQKFKNLVGALKALAFKDKVSTGDISDDAITADKVKDNETLPVNITGRSEMLQLPRNPVSDYDSLVVGNKLKVAEMGPSASNRPTDHWYHVITEVGSDITYATQLAIGMTLKALYYRVRSNGAWGGWQAIPLSVFGGVGSPTIPVYVDADGQVQKCTPSSMYVGWASNVNLSKTVNAVNGDSIQAGTGSSVTIGNAGNAKKWDGYAISVGTVVSSAGTISIA